MATSARVKFCEGLFLTLRIIVDWLIDFFFGFIYNDKKNLQLPGTTDQVLLKSATSLAKEIREKKISCETVIRAHINRIKQVNQFLNAVVDERYVDAIEEARAVNKFLAETDQTTDEIEYSKPFLGVPFTSKESTQAKGMAFTCGLVARKGMTGKEDAIVIQRLKNSGAILIAVTNMPELNLWCEARNNVYGQTNNPYNFTRTAGGSCGGECSIISACGSPMGIGTDIGGSTRMPAYYCGVFGHKPTTGLMPINGFPFYTGDELDTMVTFGTFSRTAKDIIPFLKVIMAENIKLLKLDTKVNLQDVKFYYCLEPKDLRVSPVSTEVKSAILKAADHLKTTSKYDLNEISFNEFRHSLSLWRHEMTKEDGLARNFSKDLTNQKGKVSLCAEFAKTLICQSDHTLASLMRIVDVEVLPLTNPSWAESEINTLKKRVSELLGENGVLLFPNCPTEAPYHYVSLLKPYNFAYWAIMNVLKLPATQVPLGLTKNGLPIGVQVVAGLKNDHLCIAVAEELERKFGGWVPPFYQ
ncbi:fatty-acid amide hydrolase 2 [Halyomorpha halys]|uniref:fatty-acid amide hydrolase 2 n=1 Tax=Halyomorpha halys TaxID=286706 RepID=UPI0006D4FDDD|nr:fatty-acid amide hydrolase 2-like [Halyomorpha halys]